MWPMALTLFNSLATSNGAETRSISSVEWATRLESSLFSNYISTLSPYSKANGTGDYERGIVRLILSYARLNLVEERALQHDNFIGTFMSFGGLDHLYIRSSRLWIPEIHPCDCTAITNIEPANGQMVKLTYTGKAEMQHFQSVTFSCEFKTFAFPFDIQFCSYCFTLPFYGEDELGIDPFVDGMAPILSSSEWHLRMGNVSTASYEDGSDYVFFNVVLTRQPTFWVALVIVPTFLLVQIAFVGLFFAHGNDPLNNAVTLGLATMTSMTFLVGILNDSLAKSESIPILGWFILMEIVLVVAAVVAVALVSSSLSALHRLTRKRKSPLLHWCLLHPSSILSALFVLFCALHVLNLSVLFSYCNRE